MFSKMISQVVVEEPLVSKMSEGLFRQRRNLMVTSLAIILLRYGGVTIEKLGTSGLELKFQNLNAVDAVLWIVFLYFIVRFHQYLRQESDLGIMSAFWSKVDARCLNKLIMGATTQYPTILISPAKDELRLSSFQRKSGFLWSRNVCIKRSEYGDPTMSEYTVNVLRFCFDFLVAACHVALNRSAITDYVLPFLLAGFALFYGVSGDWPGSPCIFIDASLISSVCNLAHLQTHQESI